MNTKQLLKIILNKVRINMTPEIIQNIIKNLEAKGFKAKITDKKNDIWLEYDRVKIHIDKNDNNVVYFSIRLGYNTGNLPVTFSKDEADYLTKKGVDDWNIYKYWLEFSYSPQNEQDLEKTLKKLFKEYNY